MLTLLVRVPDIANRTAIAILHDGARVVLKDYAVAVPHPGLGQQHGNPGGDPRRPYGPVPRGVYTLVALAPTLADAAPEYGAQLLAFEPQSGPALEAESFGRLVLLAYAGLRLSTAFHRLRGWKLLLLPALPLLLYALVLAPRFPATHDLLHDGYLHPLFSSDRIGRDNLSRFSDPDVDRVLDRVAREAEDEDDRELGYTRVHELLCDQVPMVPLTSSLSRWVLSDRVASATGSVVDGSTGELMVRELYLR